MTPLWKFVIKHPTFMKVVPGDSWDPPDKVPTLHVCRSRDGISGILSKKAKIYKNRQNRRFLPFTGANFALNPKLKRAGGQNPPNRPFFVISQLVDNFSH